MSFVRDPAAWQAPPVVARLQRQALVFGGLFALVAVIGAVFDRQQFFRSYLVGYLFWLTIALGGLAASLLQHVTQGRWGLVVRRIWGASARTLPLMALLFVPLLFGLEEIYVWARAEVVAVDQMLLHKSAYLNVPFFIARAALYFAIWIGSAWFLNRISLRQDETANPAIVRRAKMFAAPALGLFCLAVSFASFDWLMSLDPYWYSTMYGVYFLGGIGLSAFAFLAVVTLFLSRRPPMDKVYKPRHFHDFGKLMLAFVMLWAYFSFSQFLIIWSGNLPEEVTFYLERFGHGWKLVALALVIAHFALPFVLLLSRDLKRRANTLATVAVIVLVMRWVDLFWQVAPSYRHGLGIHWLDVVTVLAVGGIWLSLFARELQQRPLLPINAPGIEEEVTR